MPSVKDVTPSWYIPHLAASGCDIAVGTHWECNSQMPHPCPSPSSFQPLVSPQIRHEHVKLNDPCHCSTNTHIQQCTAFVCEWIRCGDGRHCVSMPGQICSVQIRLVLRSCLCVHCQSLSLTNTCYTVLHTCTVAHAYFTCVYSIMHFFLHRRPSFCVLWSFSFVIEVCRQHMDCEICCRPVVSVFCFCKCPFIAGNWAWECCHSKVIVVWGSRCAKPILCSPILFTIRGLLWFCVMHRAPWLIIAVQPVATAPIRKLEMLVAVRK